MPSVYPPINFFEDLVDPSLMEECFYIESLTNDRLRDEVGNLNLVPACDRVSGKGSSIVMAAFTHTSIDKPSRFSNGHFGVYYAAKTLKTAVKETVFHREKFLEFTNEPACELTMRVYESRKIAKPVVDLRDANNPLYDAIHADDYTHSQVIGLELKTAGAWGAVYNSKRQPSGECIAIFRPPAIALPVVATQHLKYVWNGKKIHHVYNISKSLITI